MRIFIKDFAKIAAPLTRLTRKDTEFVFGPEEIESQERLKRAIINSPAIRAIDYLSDRPVFLSVNTSYIAIGYVLSQAISETDTKKRYPSRFGSIPLNDRESRYSQSKLELYGLFRALRSTRLWTVGVSDLVVEVDAKYIKGMLNNPDIQPNAMINRWIAGILLFDFTLVHIPGDRHGPDGLSQRTPQPDDLPEPEDDFEDWIDRAYGFMHLINPTPVTTSAQRTLTMFAFSTSTLPPPVPSPSKAYRHQYEQIIDNIDVSLDFTPEELENPEAPHIPRKPRADEADLRLNYIVHILRYNTRPNDLDDGELRAFMKYVTNFFIQADKLWRRDKHGKHKIVIQPARRYRLLEQAHDGVGHHGIYATRTHLSERFWWPHLTDDV